MKSRTLHEMGGGTFGLAGRFVLAAHTMKEKPGLLAFGGALGLFPGIAGCRIGEIALGRIGDRPPPGLCGCAGARHSGFDRTFRAA
jgi:hypothetical protein